MPAPELAILHDMMTVDAMMDRALDIIRSRPWPLIACGAVLAAVYLLWAIVLPRLMEAKDHWVALQGREAITRRAAQWEDDLRQIQAERRLLKARYAGHGAVLDSSGRASTALDGLHSAADEAGVTLNAIRPGVKSRAKTYAVRRITARVTGAFPQVVRFVRAIETGRPFINVSRLSCRALDSSDSSPGSETGHEGGRREGFKIEAEVTGLAITPRFGWARAPKERVEK